MIGIALSWWNGPGIQTACEKVKKDRAALIDARFLGRSRREIVLRHVDGCVDGDWLSFSSLLFGATQIGRVHDVSLFSFLLYFPIEDVFGLLVEVKDT